VGKYLSPTPISDKLLSFIHYLSKMCVSRTNQTKTSGLVTFEELTRGGVIAWAKDIRDGQRIAHHRLLT